MKAQCIRRLLRPQNRPTVSLFHAFLLALDDTHLILSAVPNPKFSECSPSFKGANVHLHTLISWLPFSTLSILTSGRPTQRLQPLQTHFSQSISYASHSLELGTHISSKATRLLSEFPLSHLSLFLPLARTSALDLYPSLAPPSLFLFLITLQLTYSPSPPPLPP